MRTRALTELLLVSFLSVAGCGGGEGGDAATEEMAEDTAAAPGAAETMMGAAGEARNTVAVAEMRTHLNVLTAAGGDEMVPMVPQHRERVEAFITQLGGSGAAQNPAWAPTVDSVRQDLSRMQGLPANELEVLVEANAERVTRLIGMYEGAQRGGAPR